jgi:galactose mutarotase-like enzyme
MNSTPHRPWVTVRSADLVAEIDPLGAQLSVLRDRDGRDLLWDGDPSVWTGRAPLLFPIVGELAGGVYRLGSSVYPLGRHGFARRSAFRVVASQPAVALFRLTADAASLQIYPFRFELDIRFSVHGPTLAITAELHNRGDVTMPASFGFHPAFCWPLPFGEARQGHFIDFAQDESARVRRLDAHGLLMPERIPAPLTGRRLVLTDALFDHDAVIFDEVRSRSVTYGAAVGPRIRVDFPDAPMLGVWTKPHAGFICIEPWYGIADPEGYSGDFNAKPGIFHVAAGSIKTLPIEITLENDAIGA